MSKLWTGSPSANLLQYSLTIWLGIAAFLFFSTIMRALFLWHYGGLTDSLFPEYIHSFNVGMRFDLKAVAYLLLIPYVSGAIIVHTRFKFLCYWMILLALIIGIALTIINFYYYDAFGNNFDEFLFGFQGQPQAVLISIWQDYPVLKITLILSFTIAIFAKLMQYLFENIRLPAINPVLLLVTNLFLFSLYPIAMRIEYMDVFTYPADKAQFSAHQFINSASYNGILAFADLMKGKMQEYPQVNLEQGLFLYNSYLNTKLPLSQFSLHSLFKHTNKNQYLETNPPNVIFVQMESMGGHLLLFDDEKTNDLWGRLRTYIKGPHIKQDFLFRHFLSDYNSTISTLARLTFNSPMIDVFSSSLGRGNYATFVTRPFKEAGYETIFLTTGSLNWFRSGMILRKHGFDLAVGQEDILRHYPKALSSGPWGLYDQYAYDYALALMKQARDKGKPVFIYINTVSNHVPYSIPPEYKPYPVHVPAAFAQRMQISLEKMRMMFTAFQYSNDALGNFMDQLEHSEFKENTITAATGDHNHHEFRSKYSDARDGGLKHGVYLYLHVPLAYLHDVHIDVDRVGSHKDIFPTLYNLSLSNVSYPDLGNNLAGNSPELEFANNTEVIVIPEGLIALSAEPRFYPWVDTAKIQPGIPRKLTPRQQQVLTRIQAYNQLLKWQILYQWH